MRVWLPAAMMLVLGLAGCFDPGGDLKVASTELEFDGSGAGDHEETAGCDPDGQLTGSGKVEDGSLRILVEDGEGNQIFERTYDGDFTLDSSRLEGKAGTWTLRGERSSDDVLGDPFRGRYSFSLYC